MPVKFLDPLVELFDRRMNYLTMGTLPRFCLLFYLFTARLLMKKLHQVHRLQMPVRSPKQPRMFSDMFCARLIVFQQREIQDGMPETFNDPEVQNM